MIYTIDDLKIKFSNYAKLYDKIRHEVQAGRLTPIVRELYETDATVDGKYLAGRIFGPSYLSFDYALYIYSLIPEAVYKTYTSATFGKHKTKKYQNHFGTFTYRDIPPQVYPFGIIIHEEKDYSYQIATPEKALCDKLYTMPPVKNLNEFHTLLFDNLRIDEDELKKLNMESIEKIAPLYHANNLNFLIKFMRRLK